MNSVIEIMFMLLAAALQQGRGAPGNQCFQGVTVALTLAFSAGTAAAP